MSPVPCSLLLEVFEPTSLDYDGPDPNIVAWEISTDPAHDRPWLLAPRQYAEQEIDPIACTASIGQIEIGVIDVPEIPGNQDTGWMTARVHDIFGRRCRLTRYINETIGWIVIADGPAGNPSMDQSYSAYRWTIRDTRELERKLNAFQFGGVSGVVPRGPIYGFGRYTDDDGDQMLLSPLLDDDAPVSGVMKIAYNRGWVGRVMFDTHYVPQVIAGAPTAEDVRIWKESLRLIDQWAAGWRASGQDPYDMSSGNGNQGLDALIAASTINLNQFNAAAGQLGVSFGPGTRWIETFRNALVTSIGNSNTQAPAPILDDLRLDLDSDAVDAVQTTEVATGFYGARLADVLWRVHGETDWNISRPVSPITSREAFATSQEHKDGVGLTSVLLFDAETIPVGFPAADALVEVIIRYRGPASEAFPYYVEGLLGQVLTKLYTGIYSLPIYDDIDGSLYDPADLENVAFTLLSPIQYDSTVFDSMEEQVTLRQVAAVEDVREWSQKMLYAPSGWIPSLDNVAIISPILRNRPASVSPLLSLTNANSVPTPGWGIASRTVSEVNYSYSRFFVPDTADEFETEPDGLAIRPIKIQYRDDDSDLRYGRNPADYDASAFSAIGTPAGRTLSNVQETAAIMAKTARFDVLERYRGGVQSFSINVRRTDIPAVRVGTWVPWDLSWLPDRVSGVRGSVTDAAQIIAIRDDTCVWRTITLEESSALGSLGGTPGLVITLDVLETDDLDPGLVTSLVVLHDDEAFIATDSFNRADAAALGVADTGQAWIPGPFGGGTHFAISANKAVSPSLAFDLFESGANDHEVSWKVDAFGGSPGLVIPAVRGTDGLNNVQAFINATTVGITEFVAGGYPNPPLASVVLATPFVAGDRIAFRAVGDQVMVLINDEVVASATTTRPFGTLVGMGVNGSATYDDFQLKNVSPPTPAVPEHEYLFDGDLTDEKGGPSLVSNGGTLVGAAYAFTGKTGLSLTGVMAGVLAYTIMMRCKITDATAASTPYGYEKLLDFKNLVEDDGLYLQGAAPGGHPDFIIAGVEELPTALNTITSDTYQVVTITRSVAGVVKIYIDSVLQDMTFTDSANAALFTGPGGVAWFFNDDDSVGSLDTTDGAVNYIALFMRDLTQAEIITYTDQLP